MTAELWVDGPMPNFNDCIHAAKSGRGRSNGYSRLKALWTSHVALYAKKAKLVALDGPLTVSFVWREPNRKRDPDGIAAGGAKVVLDGLMVAGVLENDGWSQVYSIEHRFQVDPAKPGVLVIIGPAVPF